MKKFILSATLGLACLVGAAQEPNMSFGEPQKHEEGDIPLTKMLHADASGFWCEGRKGYSIHDNPYIVKFNTNNELEWAKGIVAPGSEGVMGNSKTYRRMLVGNGNFLKFSDGWVKADLKSSCVLEVIGLDGESKGEHVLGVNSAEKQLKSPEYTPVLSEDKSKLLIYSKLPMVKKAKEKFKVAVFNTSDWSELWRGEYELDYPSKRYPDNKWGVDNMGNAFMFKRGKIDKKVTQRMYTIDAKAQKLTQIDMPGLNDLFVYKNKWFTTDANGDMVFFAFYDTSNGSTIKGTVYVRFSKGTTAVSAKTVEPLSPEVGKSLSAHEFRDFLPYSDGSLGVLIEKYPYTKETAQSAAAGATVPTGYKFTAGAILLYRLSNSGNYQWSKAIQKQQKDAVKLTSSMAPVQGKWDSFAWHFKNDKLTVLYNCFEMQNMIIKGRATHGWKEADGTPMEKHKIFGEKCVRASFLYQIGADGSLNFSDKKFGLPLGSMHQGAIFEMSLRPRMHMQTPGGLIIMAEMNSGKRYKFGTIKL